MDTNRVSKWIGELKSLLAEDGIEREDEKLYWLVEHLREYIQRWAGFALMKELAVQQTFNNDAFCIVIGAQNVVNEIIKSHVVFPVAEWKRFENSLEFIHEHPKKENVSYVQECFDDFWEMFQK